MRVLGLLACAALLAPTAFVAGCGAGAEGVVDAGAADRVDLGAGNSDGAEGPSTPIVPDWLTDAGTPRPGTGLGPPYPIVLVHGMAGFKNIGPIEYFYGVPEALGKDGHDVWVSVADPINDSETRGKEVEAFVIGVLNSTGKAKVNLIGHSQGGFEVHYVANQLAAFVGAAVNIATPLEGDPIADVALAAGPGADDAIAALLNIYGGVAGYDSNAKACFTTLSTAGAHAFTAKYPEDPRVSYFSIVGRSAESNGGSECDVPDAPPFITRWSPYNDPLNPLLGVMSAILQGQLPAGAVHDGMVPVRAAKSGRFLGCIPADHLDEVGQVAGQPPGLGNPFDEIQFYRDLADFLVAQGF